MTIKRPAKLQNRACSAFPVRRSRITLVTIFDVLYLDGSRHQFEAKSSISGDSRAGGNY